MKYLKTILDPNMGANQAATHDYYHCPDCGEDSIYPHSEGACCHNPTCRLANKNAPRILTYGMPSRASLFEIGNRLNANFSILYPEAEAISALPMDTGSSLHRMHAAPMQLFSSQIYSTKFEIPNSSRYGIMPIFQDAESVESPFDSLKNPYRDFVPVRTKLTMSYAELVNDINEAEEAFEQLQENVLLALSKIGFHKRDIAGISQRDTVKYGSLNEGCARAKHVYLTWNGIRLVTISQWHVARQYFQINDAMFDLENIGFAMSNLDPHCSYLHPADIADEKISDVTAHAMRTITLLAMYKQGAKEYPLLSSDANKKLQKIVGNDVYRGCFRSPDKYFAFYYKNWKKLFSTYNAPVVSQDKCHMMVMTQITRQADVVQAETCAREFAEKTAKISKAANDVVPAVAVTAEAAATV